MRVPDLVQWSVQTAPPELVVARTAGAVARVALGVVTFALDPAVALSSVGTGDRVRPTWRVPADPESYVDIAPLRLRGSASWLPLPARPSYRVQASSRAVWLQPEHEERPSLQVPVQTLAIVAARPTMHLRRAKRAEASWTLTLSDGADQVLLQGCWLSLAWIGHLAGWPEPDER